MARRYTVEQLQARQDQLKRLAQRRRQQTAALSHQLKREMAAREDARFAALGRAVATVLGITTPEAWADWYARLGAPASQLLGASWAAACPPSSGTAASEVHFPVSPGRETAHPV